MFCWCWIGCCWNVFYFLNCQFCIVCFCYFKYIVGVVILVSFVVGYQMIGVGQCWIMQCFMDCCCCVVCQQFCVSGCFVLVVNDGECFFFICQVEYCFGKVGVVGGIYLVGMENQVMWVILFQCQFIGMFGFIVDVQWVGCFIFLVIMVVGFVEYIVCGIMYYQGIQFC